MKYPIDNGNKEKEEFSNLQKIINKGEMWVGRREMVGPNTVTCVHISKDEYIFAF
jgi:hypothetical protein